MDERLWVTIEGCDERHVLVGNPHTHQGRMAVRCPRHGGFNISRSDVVDASDLARVWIDGFLNGSEPRPEDMFGDGIHLLDDDHDPRWLRWRAAVGEYRRTGDWPYDPWRRLVPAPDLPDGAWTLRGDEVWRWDGARWGLAEPQPALHWKMLAGSLCDERGHCDLEDRSRHSVCVGCAHVSALGWLSDDYEIRRSGVGDEELVRSVRIAALTDAPEQFGSTLERELARDAGGWTDFVTRGALFLLERDGAAVGIAGGLPEDEDVELVSMWVAPDARGTGGSDALVQAVLGWAGERDVVLYAIDGNDPARRLYERNGFVATGETWVRNRDGATGFTMRRPPG